MDRFFGLLGLVVGLCSCAAAPPPRPLPPPVEVTSTLEATQSPSALADVSIVLADVRGARTWHTIWPVIGDARPLLGLCQRRSLAPTSAERAVVVLSISPKGHLRRVQLDRHDDLGRCIAKVMESLDFPPQGFSPVSTEALVRVDLYPHPRTF